MGKLGKIKWKKKYAYSNPVSALHDGGRDPPILAEISELFEGETEG